MKTKSKSKPCPKCHKNDMVIPIVYGFPGPELFEEAEKGLVKLGGCCCSLSVDHNKQMLWGSGVAISMRASTQKITTPCRRSKAHDDGLPCVIAYLPCLSTGRRRKFRFLKFDEAICLSGNMELIASSPCFVHAAHSDHGDYRRKNNIW